MYLQGDTKAEPEIISRQTSYTAQTM